MTNTATFVRDSVFFPPVDAMRLRTWHLVRGAHAQPGPSGDVALVVPMYAGNTAIVVVDVAGHGSQRASLSSAVAATIRTQLLRRGSPAMALRHADEFLQTHSDDLAYAVAFAAIVNPAAHTITYASAAHDVAFALDERGGSRQLLPTAPMLGIRLNSIRATPRSASIITDGLLSLRMESPRAGPLAPWTFSVRLGPQLPWSGHCGTAETPLLACWRPRAFTGMVSRQMTSLSSSRA